MSFLPLPFQMRTRYEDTPPPPPSSQYVFLMIRLHGPFRYGFTLDFFSNKPIRGRNLYGKGLPPPWRCWTGPLSSQALRRQCPPSFHIYSPEPSDFWLLPQAILVNTNTLFSLDHLLLPSLVNGALRLLEISYEGSSFFLVSPQHQFPLPRRVGPSAP